MELNAPSRIRPRKPPSAERFLGSVPGFSPPSDLSSSSSTIDELNEDDVFFCGDFSPDRDESNALHHNRQPNSTATPSMSYFSSPLSQQFQKPSSQSQNFGIVDALRNPTRPQSHFYQKTSISNSSGSSPTSSRLISAIPKPPQERLLHSSSFGRHHQSAPVNVPLLAKAMRKHRTFDDDFDEDDDFVGEMIPPHEIVARSMADSPILACSVLEGVGRTLKGRDLRQVRNAIWRQTGFLD